MKDSLKKAREKINLIDQEMARLFEERMKAAESVAEYKKEHGITVMDDLNRIRIAKAKRFLRYGSASVAEVGKQCGFDSPSYFGKCFKEATGYTPTEYRSHLGS